MYCARRLLILLATVGMALGTHAAQTQVKLVLAAEAVAPGETVMAAVHLRMPRNWHTYWRYGGDAGDPTKIQWELPSGIAAGPVMWPIPEKSNFEGLITYVYEGDVVLLIPLTIGNNVSEGVQQLKATVSWLECETAGLCVQGKQDVAASLTIAKANKPSA